VPGRRCGSGLAGTEAIVHEVKQRLGRELARIQPAADGLDKTLRLVRRRERTRRAGAAAVGLLLLPGLVLGGWLALRSGSQPSVAPPVATSGPVAGPGEPRLVLAGDQELWVVDVAGGTVRHRDLAQLSPGDPPYRMVRRGDKLVLWSYQTLTLDPSSAIAQPSVLVRDSWIFIPSAVPDRIWVGILDPTSPETERRLKAVREVAVDGRVTVADVRPPGGRWPVAATAGALVFQSQGSGQVGDQLELWDPRTGKVLRRLSGDYPVASYGDLLAWCRRSCVRLQVTNVATGQQVQVRPPAGAAGFAPEKGVFSPDGKLLAVPVRTGPTLQLALVDVDTGTATRITGAAVQQDAVFVDWSASGDTVFLAGGRPGNQRIFEYRLGTAGARRLPVEVGDFFGMAAA
jgi:hypothetical protein